MRRKVAFIAPIRTASKASLVQREVSAEQADGGIDAVISCVFTLNFGKYEKISVQPLSQKSKISDSSPYTGEPWALPRQSDKVKFKTAAVNMPAGYPAGMLQY